MEKVLHGKATKKLELNEVVFISGLARAGTTALFNQLYNTNEFASLKYSDMPFLLMPNGWKKFNRAPKTEMQERAHQDGIKIGSESPEAFDEYFWKVLLKNSYIKKEFLITQDIDDKKWSEYLQYIKLVCLSNGKKNYLSKNNNNILRLPSIKRGLPNSKILLLYRNPLDHAKSLMKQHLQFISLQKKDDFALSYFNYLGHHEFGLNHKPFYLQESSMDELKKFRQDELNYWLLIWRNYYQFLLDGAVDQTLLISFEDICQRPEMVAQFLNNMIGLDSKIQAANKFEPVPHADYPYDQSILEDCNFLYTKLNSKRAYIH